jgi:hypothetical protein
MKSIPLGTFAIVALICGTLQSQGQNLNGAYSCSGKVSSGLKLDKASNKWRAVSLNADEKFVIRLNFVERVQGQHSDPDFSYYEVDISEPGTDTPGRCFNMQVFLPTEVSRTNIKVYDDLKFVCTDATQLNIYRFNLKNGKYLSFYMAGGGLDSPDTDTPNVTMGSCIKVDKTP